MAWLTVLQKVLLEYSAKATAPRVDSEKLVSFLQVCA